MTTQPDDSLRDAVAGLFPPVARVAVQRLTPEMRIPPPFPDEEPDVARAIPKRRREYAVGRDLARQALVALGREPVALPARPDRSPAWPADVVGSITHCRGLAVAVVAPASAVRAVGIDAEPLGAVTPEVARYVTIEREREQLEPLLASMDWRTTVFSAKETVHKCVAPLSGIRLGFEDVEVSLNIEAAAFSVRHVGPARPGLPDLATLIGRFRVTPTHVIAGAVLP